MFLTINGGRLWRQRFCRRERSLAKCTREVTMVLPSTHDRVPRHTPDEINDRIHQDIAQRLHRIIGTPGTFASRLRELDEEWDIERAIELNASVLASKSPRRALSAILSFPISSAVRNPQRRRTGTGGHQPCRACCRRNAVTKPGKTSQ